MQIQQMFFSSKLSYLLQEERHQVAKLVIYFEIIIKKYVFFCFFVIFVWNCLANRLFVRPVNS